jgi:hypothetical protein
MSGFLVSLEEPEKESYEQKEAKVAPEKPQEPGKRSGFGKFLKISGIFLFVLLLTGAIAGYFYWQSLKQSPQYSLALLADAVRRDDQKAIDELIDLDAVVDSFLPQVMEKAMEMYGRNAPPSAISKVTTLAESIKPAIKKRAREEVPRVVREKIQRFEGVPSWAIAIGASWFLEINQTGDTATVISKIPERPFQLTMKRIGDKWRVIAFKDEALAKAFAEKIGQEIMKILSIESLNKIKEKVKNSDLEEIKKRVESIF